MNPNEPNGLSQPLAPTSDDMQQESSMPLGIGDFESSDASDDILSGDGGRKKANAGALMLVAVIIVGIAGIVVMKKLAGATAADISNPDIDQRIADFLDPTKNGEESSPEALVRKEKALAVLNATYAERQVPYVNVQRNPFDVSEQDGTTPIPTTEDPLDVQSRRWKREREERQRSIETAGQSFVLKSVMMGSRPLANVSGKILRVGDTVRSARDDTPFVVDSITASTVQLLSVDEKYDLEVTVSLIIDRN